MSAVESSATAAADIGRRIQGSGTHAPASAADRIRVVYAFWSTYRTDVLMVGALSLFAAFLRLYNLELMGWVADTYDRLADANGVWAGHFPQSRLALPGASFFLAPAAGLFRNSLWALQGVVIASGVVIVFVGYVTVLKVSGRRLTAAAFALTLATFPAYVHFSRDGLYDMSSALLIVLSILLLPVIRRAGVAPCLLYGFLVALSVNFRPTNVFLLPVLGVYWVALHYDQSSLRKALASAFSPQTLTVVAVVASVCLASLLLGNWADNTAAVPVTLKRAALNLWFYVRILTHGALGAPFILPLAAVGAGRLRRLDPPLFAVTAFFLVSWPVVHAPLDFYAYRFMLPVQFFVLFLVVLGLEDLVGGAKRNLAALPRAGAVYGVLASCALAAQFLIVSGLVIDRWHQRAAQSDEGLFRELRPLVAGLEDDALVISAVARGFSKTEDGPRFLDLVDYWLNHGRPPLGLSEFEATVRANADSGNATYYLYSRFEAGSDFHGGGADKFQAYFDSLAHDFGMTELFRTSEKNLGDFEWILYRVEPKDSETTTVEVGR